MKRVLSLLFAFAFALVGLSAFGDPAGLSLAMATPATNVDAIAKWAGQYDRAMLSQMLNGLDVFKDLTVDRNVSRHGKLLPKFVAEAGMRPLDLNVEENGRRERSFGGRKLYVYDCMKLFKIVPEELIESFLADMVAPGAPNIPFAQYVWSKEMEMLASEINDNFYNSEYHADASDFSAAATYSVGDYVKFTDDNYYRCVTNTSAGESPLSAAAKWTQVNGTVCFDGPAKIIADEITATNITPIATGAINNTNALDKLEQMYQAMTEAHRKKGGVFFVSYDVFWDYVKHEQSVFGATNTPESGDGRKFIYGSQKKWEVRPATWLTGSSRVIVDVNVSGAKRNLTVGTSIVGERAPRIGKIVPTVHGYKTSAKWLLGFQIGDLECLYVNDQS